MLVVAHKDRPAIVLSVQIHFELVIPVECQPGEGVVADEPGLAVGHDGVELAELPEDVAPGEDGVDPLAVPLVTLLALLRAFLEWNSLDLIPLDGSLGGSRSFQACP